MKYLSIPFCLTAVLLISCSNDKSTRGSTADTGRLAKATAKPTAAATFDNPAIKATPVNNNIILTANDRMQFSDTLFKVKAGEKITLKLTNIGRMPKSSMGHDFTLLKSGTDIALFTTQGLKARDNDYIPPAMADAVIAHTRLVGPGESDTISFIIKDKGIFDFICTFPGHFGSMRGKIVAE